MNPRLLEKYRTEVIPEMQKKFGINNPMAIPHVDKVVVNMGVGEAISDVKILDRSAVDLATITGQKPTIRRAKKAISNFKLRENMPVMLQTTLRKQKAYDFLDRFMKLVMPRLRDFSGFTDKSFDGQGNFNI